MAVEPARTRADRDQDPSRVIARALRPYATRLRLARVGILVAFLAIIAALYIVGDPSTWVVLGITALAVIATTKGVLFILPREVRADPAAAPPGPHAAGSLAPTDGRAQLEDGS